MARAPKGKTSSGHEEPKPPAAADAGKPEEPRLGMPSMWRRDDPPCPACGCTASAVHSRRTRWGKPAEVRVCDHCGRRFTHLPDGPADAPGSTGDYDGPPVPYLRTNCPACGGTDTLVRKARQPVRWHACRSCGARFRSYEE